jgi:hypothetical protein
MPNSVGLIPPSERLRLAILAVRRRLAKHESLLVRQPLDLAKGYYQRSEDATENALRCEKVELFYNNTLVATVEPDDFCLYLYPRLGTTSPGEPDIIRPDLTLDSMRYIRKQIEPLTGSMSLHTCYFPSSTTEN